MSYGMGGPMGYGGYGGYGGGMLYSFIPITEVAEVDTVEVVTHSPHSMILESLKTHYFSSTFFQIFFLIIFRKFSSKFSFHLFCFSFRKRDSLTAGRCEPVLPSQLMSPLSSRSTCEHPIKTINLFC